MTKKALLFIALFCIESALQAASDVSIATGITKGGIFSGTNPIVFKPTRAKANASRGVVARTLNAGRGVTVKTASLKTGNGDLTVGAALTKTKGRTSKLTLEAVRDIIVSAPINSTRNGITMVFNAGRGASTASPIATNGADVTISTVEPFVLGSSLSAGSGRAVLQSGRLESAQPQTVTASLVDLAQGTSFRLRGTVNGSLSVAGTIAAGPQGIGSLQINGAITLKPEATMIVNLGGTSKGVDYGSIGSTGAVTVAGALQLDCINGFEDLIDSFHTFTILTGGSITGTFTGLDNGSRVFLPDELGSLKITYTATSVVLSDWQPIIVDLTWDPGDTDAGTFVYTGTRMRGHRNYFRVHAQETDIGAWRSRLTPTTGEADLYIRRGQIPSVFLYARRSINVGADGFVLNATEFNAGEDWFLMVYADPGNPWSLLSGRAYVQDLGTLQWTDTNSSGTYDIGEPVIPSATGDLTVAGEGMRFYKATVPIGTPAWSLWLSGSDKDIAIRKSVVPFHTAFLYDRKQSGQMLVVPPYLGSGLSTYFLSVVGKPGDVVNLDSRIQEVTDIPFNGTVANVAVPDAPYRVYRLQVPVDEIAWDVSTVALAGDPNIAVRRDTVSAEFDNDGFSEVPGAVSDSITLVPNFLTDGTWFITVYGKSAYSFTLRNGPPVVTPIQFTDTKINDQPQRAGWRYYALTDIPSQLGVVGWELQLANQVPGTEIAIRRNAVPSRWRSRKNGSPTVTDTSAVDFSGPGGFLQRPGHQADIWYVGVYMPVQELGPFSLSCYPMDPPTITFDGGTRTITDLEPGRFEYVRIDVPAGVLGWDLRVKDAIGGSPAIAVRRNLLPELTPFGQLTNLPGWAPPTVISWPLGNQWVGGIDWTGYTMDGPSLPTGNRLIAGMGRPLEAGSYYVGVYNGGATTVTSCVLESRGIGPGQTYTVTPVNYAGGTAPITNLAPREARYFKVTVPPNSPSWELLLDLTAGDADLVVRYGTVPDFSATIFGEVYDAGRGLEVEMKKIGPERYVLLPAEGQSLIPEGDYFIAVMGEGTGASGATIGTGSSSGLLTSTGPLAVTELGMASETPITHPVSLVSGQIKAYHFDVPVDTYSLEVRLQGRVGNPDMRVLGSVLLPKPASEYGADGGIRTFPFFGGDATTFIYTLSNPPSGKWSIVVNAGTIDPASATLVITALGVVPVAFDGGTVVTTNHSPGTIRYFSVDVPAGAVGWDVRIKDVTGPMPQLWIRRDVVPGPPSEVTPGWAYWTAIDWPSNYETIGGVDWTGYTLNGGGAPVPPRLVTGMGRPLVPGKYYLAVPNSSTTQPISYTVDSRGIGPGMTYAVTTLDYASGTANISGLAPREANYFKVTIPGNVPSWEVTLSAGAGSEIELLAREGAIPDFAALRAGSIYRQNPEGCEIEMQKIGPERFVLLPSAGNNFITPGDYYLAVVGEGVGPAGSTIGTGTSSGVLQSGPLFVKDLGTANAAGTTEHVDLVGGQLKAYRFNVPAGTDSLEVRMDSIVGTPWIALGETRFPSPAGEYYPGRPSIGSGPHNEYGCDGGNGGPSSTKIITYPNPTPGEWRVLVRAGHGAFPTYPFDAAQADLVVTALTTVPLNYDGGTFNVVGQQPDTWRYFVVNVPAGVAGWDVRLKDVTGAVPAMMVRRDDLPSVPASLIPEYIPSSWRPSASTTWPTGYQWLAGIDWTGYPLDAAGVSVPPRIVAGMGRPLEAGTYYVGIYNNTINPTTYTVDSRGIGDGRIYPVTPLAFAGGTATITDLPRREAQYFKVTIPASTPSWEVTLSSTVGDVELLARAGAIPDFAALREGDVYNATYGAEIEMKKAGPDRYVLLPILNGTTLAAGDYYIAVVSEGANPGTTTIGTGASSGVLTSVGILNVSDLGTATVGGITEPIALAGGQIKAYQFTVAPGTESLEVRLQNATGYPAMTVVQGTRLPVPPGAFPLGSFPYADYGYDGGTGGTQSASIHSVASPAAGVWTVVVRARPDPANPIPPMDASYPDASANLVIRSKQNILLNFAESLNSGGGTNTDTRQATDGEYNIYKITVPAILDAQPVLGWIIHTQVFQGAVSMEVYKNASDPTSGIGIPIGVAVVVPPYLTFGDAWYVRVKATGLTNYKITSRPVTLERPVWQMPSPHNVVFGDSGNDSSGNPLPGDRGTDLEEGYWHFYAVDVPPDNLGLLRTELQAISGNPDLYIREDGVPTTNHLSNGNFGTTLTPRALTGATTSYGNWVPFNGRTETRLKPGRWYIGVRAGGNSNVRYRLITSTGIVKDMALNPASSTIQIPNNVTGQSLADNDWRYFRFTVPVAAPTVWTLTFGEQLGDVVMWLRDTVPPGAKEDNTLFRIGSWASDAKNQGPYSLGFDAPGPHPYATPPLRPGQTYYVGIRSNNSATFSLSSNTDSDTVPVPPTVDFYSGTVTDTVPSGSPGSPGIRRYRVLVPPEATQFRYSATHSSSVVIRIEQGTLTADSGFAQHYISSGANSSTSQDVSLTHYPWLPNQTYYVSFVNAGAGDQPITFTMDGKNALTEDEDGDGMPDAWEMQYFNSIFQTATGDNDNDGVNNLTEFMDGTIPTDPTSAKYTVTVLAKNGTADITPLQTKYNKDTVVSITNTPNAGNNFVGWSGGPFLNDNFALKATGTITIPTDGAWTFGINAADGSRLTVDGTALAPDDSIHEARDAFRTVNLTAGPHTIELLAFEYTGGEGLELFAASGTFSAFNTDFKLIGDVANGGLAVETNVGGTNVPGFTVRQVESLSTLIFSLQNASNLLAGSIASRQDIMGVTDVINFLTYDFSEGHFANNAYFPLSESIQDNPLSLTVKGNVTITALNSIPLETALDTTGLVWTTGSNCPWLGENDPNAFDGVDAAGSGPIGDSQSSYLQTTVTGPGTVNFKWRISAASGDTMAFIVDGVVRAFLVGDTAWTNSSNFSVSGAGVHTLTWHYTKNGSGSSGSDRAWLDQVVFTP